MSNYLHFIIEKKEQETHDAISLFLKEKTGKEISFEPGQFLTLLFDVDGEEVRRGFSIASSPDELPLIRLTIKKVADGFTSSVIFNELKVGDEIKSLPPLGGFVVNPSPDQKREMILFGAGSGITPLMSMIKSVLPTEPESKITLFYGNRNEDSIIYKNELKQLEEKYEGRFKVIHSLSQPSDNWDGLKGRLDREKVESLLSEIDDDELMRSDFYLCGPGQMMKDIISVLEEKNVTRDQIHKENYTIEVLDDDEEIEEVTRSVTLYVAGEKHIISVEPGESILEKALDVGLELPSSCQFGSCGTCRAKLLSGRLKLVEQTALSDEERAEGYCLTCVGFPASDNVVILYDDEFGF